MKYLITAVALATVLGTTYALAQPGSGSCNQHPDAPYCQGGGDGGSNGGSNNENTSTSNGVGVGIGIGSAESSSDSSSNSNASGGSVSNRNSVQGGRSSASAGASIGNTTASGGDATGGKSEAAVAVDNTDNSSYSYKEETAVASAASVFAGYCQTGMSGSVEAGGFSVVNPEAFCNNIRMAAVYQEAYAWEIAHDKPEQAEVYYEKYTGHLQDAHELLEATDGVATVDSFFGYLIRPIAVVAAVILLL
jgi:hypothetical protein